MWYIVDEKEREENAKRIMENFKRASEEAAKREAARKAWLESHTCEHCGRHDPLPPWLMY